jgi:hypothetical protein
MQVVSGACLSLMFWRGDFVAYRANRQNATAADDADDNIIIVSFRFFQSVRPAV